MIPVQQKYHGGGGDDIIPGDCVRACVASILRLPAESVPHFVAGEWAPEGRNLWWLAALNDWLRYVGYNLTAVQTVYYKASPPREFASMIEMYDRLPAPKYDRCRRGYWMASVISENFANSTHAIVMLDDQVAHDPSTKPRRTPYEFVGETLFVSPEPWRAR